MEWVPTIWDECERIFRSRLRDPKTAFDEETKKRRKVGFLCFPEGRLMELLQLLEAIENRPVFRATDREKVTLNEKVFGSVY